MNFQLKALVAALALVASTGSAQAGIQLANTGNSSMVLTLLDKSASISASFDLGPLLTDFNALAVGNTDVSWSLNTGAYATAWNTFWATASEASTVWAVVGVDTTGLGAGAKNFTSSYLSGTTVMTTATQNTTVNNIATYFQATNNGGTHLTNPDGAAVFTSGGGYAGNNSVYGADNKLSNAAANVFVAAAGINTQLTILKSASAATNGANTTVSFLGNNNGVNGSFAAATLNFSKASGTLTLDVAQAVPEADTSAMLIAGLGLMGAFARRRSV